MGFYGQKTSQTAPVTSVSIDDIEIGKDEDVVNIKGTKVLLSGIGFYCGERDGCVLIGNYQEWLAAGKPAMPAEYIMLELATKEYVDSIPHITKRVLESNGYYEIWSDGIIKLCATTDNIMTTNGYIVVDVPPIIKGKKMIDITATNSYVSGSNSIYAHLTTQYNEETIVFYFRAAKESTEDFLAKITYQITVYDPSLVG